MAEDRTIRVRLQAEVQSYMQGMRSAAGATADFGKQVSGMGTATNANLEKVGKSALVMAGGLTVAMAGAAKAAIDWESAWAGVTKTVEGSQGQLDSLESGLRGMAKELPASHREIAAVAEAAGALGVQTGAIEGFTRTMIDLGETTDVTADQAATAMAQIANIMGTAHSDFDRMGSTLVALGNAGASTESEILTLANRMAAAGAIAGLSEAEVFGFASALASVGVEAEAGGTAISKVFTRIRDAVIDGGDNLETFAQVAGVTAEQFAQAFRESPSEAVMMFTEGLDRINAAGQSTSAIFKELDLNDERLKRAMLSIAGASEEQRRQMELAIDAWAENNALQTEAEKRYETTAAKMEMARNQIVDLGIDMGSVFLPSITGAVGVLGNFADGLASLPGPAKTAAAGLTGVATVGLGLVGLAGTLAPKFDALKNSLAGMGTGGQFLGRNLGKISAGLAGLGVAVGAGVLAYEMATRRSREYKEEVRKLSGALDPVIAGQESLNDVLGDFFDLYNQGVGADQTEALNKLGVSFDDIRDSIVAGADALDPLREAIRGLGIDMLGTDIGEQRFEALRNIADELGVSTSAVSDLLDVIGTWSDEAQAGAKEALERGRAEKEFSAAAFESAIAANTAADGTINYVGALEALAPEADAAKGATEGTAGALATVEDVAEAAADAVDAFTDSLDILYDSAFGIQTATDALQSSLNDLPDVLKEAREDGLDLNDTLTDMSDAGIDVRSHMQGMVKDAMDLIAEWREQGVQGEQLAGNIGLLSESFREQAEAAGLPAPVVDHYLGVLAEIPTDASTDVTARGVDKAIADVIRFRALLISVQTMSVVAQVRARIGSAQGGLVPGFASGGQVGAFAGAPTGTDTVPAMLTPGEFVLRKGAVDKLGVPFLTMLNAAQFAQGGAVRMASGGEVPTGFDLVQAMHSTGHMSDDEYMEHLRRRLAEFRQFSSEWVAAHNELAQMEKKAADDLTAHLEDDYQRRREINNNLYELGLLSTEDHLFNLERRKAREVEYSDEWVALERERLSVMQSMLDEERRIEDARFELGEISTSAYLAILRKRLAGTETYSQEYMATLRDIQRLEAQVVSEQADLVRDQAKLWDYQYELGEVSTAAYLEQLRRRLEGLEKYSDEYMRVWRQIQSVEEGGMTAAAGTYVRDFSWLADYHPNVLAQMQAQGLGPFSGDPRMAGGTVDRLGNTLSVIPAAQSLTQVTVAPQIRVYTSDPDTRVVVDDGGRAAEALRRAG